MNPCGGTSLLGAAGVGPGGRLGSGPSGGAQLQEDAIAGRAGIFCAGASGASVRGPWRVSLASGKRSAYRKVESHTPHKKTAVIMKLMLRQFYRDNQLKLKAEC